MLYSEAISEMLHMLEFGVQQIVDKVLEGYTRDDLLKQL